MAIEVATITTKAMAIEVEVAKLIIEAAFIMAITTTAAAATTVTDFRRKFKVATVIFNFSLAMVMVVPSIRAIDWIVAKVVTTIIIANFVLVFYYFPDFLWGICLHISQVLCTFYAIILSNQIPAFLFGLSSSH
jgi:hypothetical protein